MGKLTIYAKTMYFDSVVAIFFMNSFSVSFLFFPGLKFLTRAIEIRYRLGSSPCAQHTSQGAQERERLLGSLGEIIPIPCPYG